MQGIEMRENGRVELCRLPGFFVVLALTFFVCLSSDFLRAQDGVHARPDETISELMSGSGGAEPAAMPSSQAGLWRITGVFILGAALGVVLLLSWQRHRPSSGSVQVSRDALEVIGRAPLSSKHSACLLKVGSARVVVVALCGDTMSPLCTIEGEDEIARVLGETEESSGRAPWLEEKDGEELDKTASEGGGRPFDGSQRADYPEQSEAEK